MRWLLSTKSAIKRSEQRQEYSSGVFIVNFEHTQSCTLSPLIYVYNRCNQASTIL